MERKSTQTGIHAEAFNKVCKALNKVCNAQRSDWDLCVPVVLWAYRATCKKLTGQMPSRLVYEANDDLPMKYIVPSPCITTPANRTDHRALKEGIAQLEEEECLGPNEGIQHGSLRIQELMNEKARLREKSTIAEEEVKKLEERMRKDFFDKKIVVIKQDVHDYVDKF